MYPTPIALSPKGAVLRVIVIGRISTDQQNEENIAASYRYVEQHLSQMYDGPMEIERLGERASGMLADRATIRIAEQRIAAGTVDVVIAEDLSRIFRNPRHQYVFVQNCVDAGVRLICLADHLDTSDPNWEVMLATAAIRHGLFVPDTRRRVRRTATHSFHNGGMVLRIRYGYRKLTKEEAASGHFGPLGLRIAKLAECTPTIQLMCEWVRTRVSYVRIAERLNLSGVAPGPYASQHRWTRGQVINLLRDPILSGTRRFRVVTHEPVYGTGRHRRRKTPEPESMAYPELAHISVDEQQDMWRVMNARTETWRCSIKQSSKRREVPRSRAYWPGQSATCGICGGLMYDMGKFLRCRNALPAATDRCWNHVHVPIALTRQKVVDWLLEQSSFACGLSQAVSTIVRCEAERAEVGANSERVELDRQITERANSVQNLIKAIARGGALDVLLSELQTHQSELERVQRQRNAQSPSHDATAPTLNHSANSGIWAQLHCMLADSYELGDVLRELIPEFRIFPVQTLDTPFVRPRAQLSVQFQIHSANPSVPSSENDFSGVLDLFEPPVHIRWREPCVAIRKSNPRRSLKKIAVDLGIGHMTVKRALHYDRLMQAAGLTVPYRCLTKAPDHASRWGSRRGSLP